MEGLGALLQEKYHVEIELKEPTAIYMERPPNAEYIHRSAANPFWASIGLSVSPPVGKWNAKESLVSLDT